MNRFRKHFECIGFGENGDEHEQQPRHGENTIVLIEGTNLLCRNACKMVLEGKKMDEVQTALISEYKQLREIMHWQRGWSGRSSSTDSIEDPTTWAKLQPPYRFANQALTTGRIPQNLWVKLHQYAIEYAIKIADALEKEPPRGTIVSIVQQEGYLGIHWSNLQPAEATT